MEKCQSGEAGYKIVGNKCFFFEKVSFSKEAAIENCANKFSSGGKLVEPKTIEICELLEREGDASFGAFNIHTSYV